MPTSWIVADDTLQAMLEAYLSSISGGADWNIDLYKNNYTPTPGDDASDYTPADFDGYMQGEVDVSAFGPVSVVSHVAISVNSVTVTFSSSAIATPEIVYGYFITDSGGDLVLAERFGTSITVNPNNNVNITPELRHTTYDA